jgi:hypothetical protein
MKRDFSQPFRTRPAYAYLLVETAPGMFLQFANSEDPTLTYYTVLLTEVDDAINPSLHLVRFLHENGLALEEFREVARENRVTYSFIDDTPGTVETDICLYIRATRTAQWVDKDNEEALFVPLETLLENFFASPAVIPVVSRGAAHLIVERYLLKKHGQPDQ